MIRKLIFSCSLSSTFISLLPTLSGVWCWVNGIQSAVRVEGAKVKQKRKVVVFYSNTMSYHKAATTLIMNNIFYIQDVNRFKSKNTDGGFKINDFSTLNTFAIPVLHYSRQPKTHHQKGSKRERSQMLGVNHCSLKSHSSK